MGSWRLFGNTVCAVTLVLATTAAASAQGIGIRGFGLLGNVTFTAKDSFDAILGSHKGGVYGGGAEVLVPWNPEPRRRTRIPRRPTGSFFGSVAAWQFQDRGERVFVGPNDDLFRLGIPVRITVTPLEITGGYRLAPIARRYAPYGGGGYSSYRYRETSDFADPEEDVDTRFTGYHVLGGLDVQLLHWLWIGGEVAYSSIKDALGEGGVSAHYGEDNLGGTSLRVKISVGR